MTTIPTFESIAVTNGSNPVVTLAPMEITAITGTLPTTIDSVRVQLQAGERLTGWALAVYPWGNYSVSTLTVFDPSFNVVARSSTANGVPETDPTSGAVGPGTYFDFVASTAGNYTVAIQGDTSYSPHYTYANGQLTYSPAQNYFLDLRPIELDNSNLNPTLNAGDAAKLQYSGGGLYAWLDSTDTLNLSGPTGRGFQIAGNWTETTTPAPGTNFTTSTYSATQATLESPTGAVPLTLPGGNLTITTAPNGYGGAFGQVASGLTGSVSIPLGAFANPVGGPFGLVLNYVDGSTTLSKVGARWGIALGSDPAVNALGLPVDPSVPYIYLSAGKTAVGATFGQVSVGTGTGTSVSAVVDPADPSFYLDIQGVPVINEFAFGSSLHAEIPYTPAVAPSHWAGNNLYGDLYFKGTVNIGDAVEEIPAIVSGSVVANLDPQGSGSLAAIQQKAADLANGRLTSQEANDFAIGVNGQVSVAFKKGATFIIPVGAGSAIFSGPQQALYLAGGTINPLAGTPVAFLTQGASYAADGYFSESGQFDVRLSGSYQVLGTTLADGYLDVNNNAISSNAYLNFGDGNVDVGGTIGYDGSFTLTAQLDLGLGGGFNYAGFDIYAGINGTVGLTISNTGVTASFTGGVDWNASIAGISLGSYSNGFTFSAGVNWDDLTDSIDSAVEDYAWGLIDEVASTLTGGWNQIESGIENGWNDVVNWFDSL
jgi:hypothetical protein